MDDRSSKWWSCSYAVVAMAVCGVAWAGGCTVDDGVGADGQQDQQQANHDSEDTGEPDTDPADGGDADTGSEDTDAGHTDADADAGDQDADTGGDDEFEPPEGMVLVPEGSYTRGCNEDIDDACSDPARMAYDHERPAHDVEVSAFVIDIHEVTEREWDECVDAGACDPPIYDDFYDGHGPDYPVVNITADQAMDYCEWAGARLPTEAEWEKAARGTDQRIYPWGNDEPDCSLVNFDDCGGEIAPVGEHPDGASPYGVEGMGGNVRNFAADWFDSDYYDDAPNTDPQGPDSGHSRAVRGGSFRVGPAFLRTSARYSMEGGEAGYDNATGLRCARTVDLD